MILSFDKIDSKFIKVYNPHKIFLGAIKMYGSKLKFHPAVDIILDPDELVFIANYMRDRQ